MFFVWYMRWAIGNYEKRHEKRNSVNGLTCVTFWACSPHHLRCNIPVSIFTMELVILICHSSVAFKKSPQKIQGYFLQNYTATMVLILLFIQNSSPTLWNIGAKKTRQKKLKTCSTADVPSCWVKLHLSITSFVSPPHNLGCTRTQTFLSLSYHLKVTRTEESRRSEKYVGETLI